MENNDDFWTGKDAPLNWIGAFFFSFCAIMIIGTAIYVPIEMERKYQEEKACEDWVGENHIYHEGWCYRVIDGKAKFVDVEFEKKLKAVDK